MEQQHTNPEDDYSFFFDFDFELSLWDKVMVVALLCVVIVASPILIPYEPFPQERFYRSVKVVRFHPVKV